MKIAILTSPNQWFIPYAKELNQQIKNSKLFYNHTEIFNFDIVFILSYHKIIDKNFLKHNKHNIVIHASNLPQGKGWAPLFHQVIEGKNEITFSLFEADDKADNGDIYLQKNLKLNGLELYEELREKQARFTLNMCLEFLKLYPNIQAKKQVGKESFYPKRSPKDSELDINKSLNEQFNLLRIASNEDFPAFFYKDGKKFILKIYLDSMGGGKALILNLENFKTLNKTKKEKIRLFRNHPNTKKYLYNQYFISKREHFNFIQKLKKNSKKTYFCLSLNHIILGSINLDKLNKTTASFGFYSNPFSHLSGLGRILEQSSIYLACNFLKIKVLKLEIFQENLQVINLHKKFGFAITKETIKHDKKIFIMQLVF